MAENKRHGMRLGPIDKVNTAGDRGWAGGGSNEKNCALCSAAGVINLCRGYSQWSTGMIAEALHTGDHREGAGDSVDAQAANIRVIGEALTGRQSRQLGKMMNEVDYTNSLIYMEGQPDDTVFAVCCSGTLIGGGQRRCHWLNAISVAGNIRFFDFQPMKATEATSMPGLLNPSTCNKPFIGVVTQRNYSSTNNTMHTSDQPGCFDTTSARMVILAFPPQANI